jgi:hypothetical protein
MYRAGRYLRGQQICTMRERKIRYVGLCAWDRVGVVLCARVGCHAHANIRISCAALPLVNSPGTSGSRFGGWHCRGVSVAVEVSIFR